MMINIMSVKLGESENYWKQRIITLPILVYFFHKVDETTLSVLSGVVLFCQNAVCLEDPILPQLLKDTLQILHGKINRLLLHENYRKKIMTPTNLYVYHLSLS